MDRYLTEEEQARLLTLLRKEGAVCLLARRDDAVCRALINSGARIHEFSLVTVGDTLAALRIGYLFVPREHRKGYSAGRAKDHSVYLTNPLREALEDLLKVRALMTGGEDGRAEDPLVIGREGRRLSVRSYQARMKKWGAQAGLPPRFSPHWLRHTLAMNLKRRSTAPDPRGVLKAALGHADIRSGGIYMTTSREEVEEALRQAAGKGRRRMRIRALRREFEGRAG